MKVPAFVQLPARAIEVPAVPAARMPLAPIDTSPFTVVAPAVLYPILRDAAVAITVFPLKLLEPPTCKEPYVLVVLFKRIEPEPVFKTINELVMALSPVIDSLPV